MLRQRSCYGAPLLHIRKNYEDHTMKTNRSPESHHLRVMSFNVLMDLPAKENVPTEAAQNRMRAVCKEIQTYAPDLLGVQEDTLRWLNAFSELLPEYHMVYSDEPVYKLTEHCAVLYRKDSVCKAQGSHWLTCDGTKETVALTVADLTGTGAYAMNEDELESLGIRADSSDAVLKEHRKFGDETFNYLNARRMTYAVLDIDGIEVLHINTHFQHRGLGTAYMTPALNKLRNFERLKQYRILCEHTDVLKQRFPGAVVILTGDFNDLAESDIYRAVSDTYCDTSKQALQKAGYPGSWNCAYLRCSQGDNYPSENEGKDGGCIDFCFVQPDENISVSCFQTGLGRASVTACDGSEKMIYTSDHLPIVIHFEIDK